MLWWDINRNLNANNQNIISNRDSEEFRLIQTYEACVIKELIIQNRTIRFVNIRLE